MPLEYQRGSVFLLGKRKKAWFGKYRIWQLDPTTGIRAIKQRTKKIGYKSEMTKFEAERKLQEVIAAENGSNSKQSIPNAASITLKWFVQERHLPMMTCRETTRKTTAYEIRRYILEKFGDCQLDSLGLFELQTHLNALSKNFSDSVVRHTYVNLRSIYNNAVELDFLLKSPARKLKMPDTNPPDKSTLEPKLIMQLLKAIQDPRDRCVFAIGVFCALRTAEVFGLTWGCWLEQHLLIRNTAFEGHLQLDKVKTSDSRGLVPIPALVQPTVSLWHAVCIDTNPASLMFATNGRGDRKGQRVPFDSTNFMERRIHPIADSLGIPRHLVTFQVMRRTAATELQFHGTLKDAQAALRHKSIKTTGNIYMQAVPESVKAALDSRTEAVFRSGRENH